MRTRILRVVAVAAIAGLLAFQTGARTSTVKAFSYASMTTLQKRLLSGLAEFELNPQNATTRDSAVRLSPRRVDLSPQSPSRAQLKNYFADSNGDCPVNYGDNVKVNQNCLNLTDADLQGRSQANNETSIAQDPNHPSHLVASDNDYRR